MDGQTEAQILMSIYVNLQCTKNIRQIVIAHVITISNTKLLFCHLLITCTNVILLLAIDFFIGSV